MNCEMCGRPIRGRYYRVSVEGSVLTVCPRCFARTKGSLVEIGDTNAPSKPAPRLRQTMSRKPVRRLPPEMRLTVVENYAEVVKDARQRMGFTREVLASIVGEKVSTIRRIEEGQLEPPISLARKLEKALKIVLVVEESEEEGGGFGGSLGELTLGDVADLKFEDEG